MFHVISYDIPDDQRRSRLAKVLKGFGTRVQYSVFEAHLTNAQFQQMKACRLHASSIPLRIPFATTPSVMLAPVGSKSLLSEM